MLQMIRQKPDVPVLIVGAGINGIAVFRELALHGIDALIVDKGDFCSGASAASSHMLHGGIRYLENGEFRLVQEALIERNRMLLNAPHYAKPLPTTIPIFHWLSGTFNAPLKFLGLLNRPSERGALIIKMGLMMYDFFTRNLRVMPTHSLELRAQSLERRPQLNPAIVCTASYYDAWMPFPERICLELILDAEALHSGVRALNYVRLDGASGDTVTLRDDLTGQTYTVKPKIVINAAGPWIDFANQAMGRATQLIGGTKGSHLVVDHPELFQATAGSEIFFENKDGRICLIFPFVDGKTIIGTTDIRVDDPEQANCTDDEVDYMLDLVRFVFPKISVDRSHIVFRFCGVRPLPASNNPSYTGQISRDHSIQTLEPGKGLAFPILSLVGGKWTTFRAFGEQTADVIFKRLGRSRRDSTEKLPIGGGRDYPKTDADQKRWLADWGTKTHLTDERLQTLFERYGTRAGEIAEFLVAQQDEALQQQPDYSRREVIFLTIREKVVHLDDLLLRRSLLAMLGQVNAGLLHEVAGIMGTALGWSADETRREVDRTIEILQTRHGIQSELLRSAGARQRSVAGDK
jgi:glycerol-3-phosphate dehydrogenase